MSIHHRRETAPARLGQLAVALLPLVLLLVTCAPPFAATAPTATLVPPVTVELSSKIDSQGTLLTDVEVVSSDGRAKLSLVKGTRVLDSNNQPAKSIAVTPLLPAESNQALLAGVAFDFGGATVRPLGLLTLSYDEPPAVSSINVQDPQIAGFLEEQKAWVKTNNPSTANLKTRTVTLRVGTLGTFVVLFWYTATTPPIS